MRAGFFRGRWCGRHDFIWQGDISRSPEATNVGAVFVFDAEKRPHASAADFGEADEEREEGGMLQLIGVDGVEDPIEAEDWVEDHGNIVDPGVFVAQDVAKKWVFCVWVT